MSILTSILPELKSKVFSYNVYSPVCIQNVLHASEIFSLCHNNELSVNVDDDQVMFGVFKKAYFQMLDTMECVLNKDPV